MRMHREDTAYFDETPDRETASEGYAQRFSGEAGDYFLDVQSRTLLELLDPWPGARILDVGGGHAQTAVPLVRNGFQVTVAGSDASCRERLSRLLDSGSYRFDRVDLLRLPYADGSFDGVLAFRLLPHMRQWRRLIAELCRVSRRVVIVDYPDLASFNLFSEALFQAKKAYERNTRPFICFTRREILTEFEKWGFSRPEFRPQFFIPMVVHRALGRARLSRKIEALCDRVGLTRSFGSPVILRVERLTPFSG